MATRNRKRIKVNNLALAIGAILAIIYWKEILFLGLAFAAIYVLWKSRRQIMDLLRKAGDKIATLNE